MSESGIQLLTGLSGVGIFALTAVVIPLYFVPFNERHPVASANDSASPKRASVKCPEGTVLVGNSGYVVGGNTGSFPDGETDVSLVTLDVFAGEAVATA